MKRRPFEKRKKHPPKEPSFSDQLAEFGVDAEEVPPVFRERMLAELKRQRWETEERTRLFHEEQQRRTLHLLGQTFPEVGGLLDELMALEF